MKIHAIQTGSVSIKKKQQVGEGNGPMRLLNIFRDDAWTEFLPIYAWVIEHPEGVIVVDTGETAKITQPGYFPGWNPYFKWNVRMNIPPEQEIGPQLHALGIASADVKKVVLTHLHTDHAGGMAAFPQSEFFISEPDYRDAYTWRGPVNGYLTRHWPSWLKPTLIHFAPTEVLRPFPQAYALTQKQDVWVLPTPGHTPAHVSVVVQDGDDWVFLAGDTTYSQQALVQQQVDGISLHPPTTLHTIQQILGLAHSHHLVYLPSHDPQSGLRLEKRQAVFG